MSIVTKSKFLTEEELQTIKNLQQKTQNLILELGEIELFKIQLNQRYDSAKEYLQEISNSEKEFSEKLQEIYGKINFNVETGEISPLS